MIYVLRTRGAPFIKIGFSESDIGSRIKTLQTGCPYEIELIHARPGDIKDEKEIHRKLSTHRASGEWFHMTTDSLGHFGLKYDQPPIDPLSVNHVLTMRQLKINKAFSFYRNSKTEWMITVDEFCKKYGCRFQELLKLSSHPEANFMLIETSENDIWERFRTRIEAKDPDTKKMYLVNTKAL